MYQHFSETDLLHILVLFEINLALLLQSCSGIPVAPLVPVAQQIVNPTSNFLSSGISRKLSVNNPLVYPSTSF